MCVREKEREREMMRVILSKKKEETDALKKFSKKVFFTFSNKDGIITHSKNAVLLKFFILPNRNTSDVSSQPMQKAVNFPRAQ